MKVCLKCQLAHNSLPLVFIPQPIKSARDLTYQDYFDPVDDDESFMGEEENRKDVQHEEEENETDNDEIVDEYVVESCGVSSY